MVLNICLRGLVLLGRFFFLFTAAKFLTLEDLGTYSLIAVTVGYAFYLVGLDFYSFTTRLIIGSTESEKKAIVLNQFRVYVGSLAVFFIPLLGVFLFGILEWKWLIIFYSLLVSGHLSQEMGRLLVSLEQPTKANLILLVGSATWTFPVSLSFWITPSLRTLDLVINSWLISSVLSVIVGGLYLRFISWPQIFKERPSADWVWGGIKTAFPFLLSTLAIRGIFTFDRYAITLVDNLAMVGVYAVYIGLCYAMQSFVEVAVFQFMYPRLIRAVNTDNRAEFRTLLIGLSIKTSAAVLFCVTVLVLLSNQIFLYMDKPEYLANLPVFWTLLCAFSLWVLSYVAHYGLYALKRDRLIFLGHIVPLAIFILGLVYLKTDSGLQRVATSMAIAFAFSFVIKSVGLIKPYMKFMRASS